MSTQLAQPVGVAVVGCGNIATRYVKSVNRHSELKLVGAYDQDPARLSEVTESSGCRAYDSLDELLADPSIDIVVNLTSPQAHYSVTSQCLRAGRHVYSEKPLTLRHQDADELVRIAADEGVRLGGSPSVWLAPAQQTAWREVASGRLGQVRVVYAEANHGRIESWHPAPEAFYEIGPVFDVGVYPLALLTAIFGPAQSVTTYGNVIMPNRVNRDGVPFTVTTPDFVVAILEIATGPLIRLTCNFYVGRASTQQGIEFHGDLASCKLDNWLQPQAGVSVADFGAEYQPVPLVDEADPEVDWTRGLRDMAQALAEGREHRATGAHAAHIVEILNAVATSAAEQRTIEVTSKFPQPQPIGWTLPGE